MPRISPWQRPLIAAALVLGLGTAVQAQTSAPLKPKGEGPRLTEAQRQKVFPETRALAAQDHRARIAILQQGERCISAAPNGDGLRTCMRQERDALQNQRQQHRDALRQVFVRNGIPVPDWSQRKGGTSPRPAGGGYGWDRPGQPTQPLPLR
ncbi:MAG: hypothetical protein NTW51_15370 [Cyanobacteria bacterium]|nr:hypothetical protein [Cyanobacteriota bacterium]